MELLIRFVFYSNSICDISLMNYITAFEKIAINFIFLFFNEDEKLKAAPKGDIAASLQIMEVKIQVF